MSRQDLRLVSVSLNQLNQLTSSVHGLVMHNQKISRVCVVGNVLSIDSNETKSTYSITDYTGPRIQVVLWKNNFDENRMADLDKITEATYVKVYGQSRRESDQSVIIVAFQIEPLANLNDITIHLLEVVKHAKDLKQMKFKVLGNLDPNNNQLTFSGLSGKAVPNMFGFNQIQALVYDAIKSDTSDEGISSADIYSSLRSINQVTLKQTIDFLLNNDHIYDSSDDKYKTLE